MDSLKSSLESYLMVLVHPFRMHQQFRHGVALPGHDGHLYEPLTLAESIGISWVFAIIRGLFKIVLLNFFLQSFLTMDGGDFTFLKDLVGESGISTAYFLLFSAALDIIFFPIVTLLMTEFWSWVIRIYAGWLNPDLAVEEIAGQITTHSLSSNVICVVPVLGDIFQTFLFYFLLYAGLRSNLEASRTLALVILITPTMVALMILSLFLMGIFYLAF